MSLYNSIEKIKYTDNLSDAVSLDEYIVFGNERSEEKYIVFRFYNNVNQKLLGMKFEVSQFDMHDNLIERSVVIYNSFLAKANSSFVPKAKLKAQYACKRISVKLVQAAFDRVLWNEGEYIDNTYKFEHFVRDEKYIEETERPKIVTSAPRQKKPSRDDTERFRARNIMKKNVAVFPKVFYWITGILVVIALVVAVCLFPRYSKRFTLSGYDLELVAADTVRVCGYEGDDGVLNVPKTIKDVRKDKEYSVVAIGKGAFNRLKASVVNLPESVVVIEKGAFRDMPNLKTVTCTSENVTVNSLAFDKITSLTSFGMRGALLMENCFYGCLNLGEIAFRQTDVQRFVDLFGVQSYTTEVLFMGDEYDNSEEFFEGLERYSAPDEA